MRQQAQAGSAAEPQDNWMVRLGGLAALGIGLGYIIIIVLFVPLGAKPGGAEGWLTHLAAHTPAWQAIIAVSVLTDLFFVPITLSLYLVLKAINRSAMLLASACMGLFVVLDLALTWPNYTALIGYSAGFATTGEAQRASILAAAQYPAGVLDSVLLFVYNTLTLSLGIFITGLVMLRGSFHRASAYLGLATGILGTAAVAGAFFVDTGIVTILASVLTTLWAIFVGFRLLRLG